MAEALRWTSQDSTLALSGDLDRDSLLPFWQQRETLLKASRRWIRCAGASGFRRVGAVGASLSTADPFNAILRDFWCQ